MKLQQEFDPSMLNGHVSLDQLIAAIDAATTTIKIKVPSTDYYARPGEAETETLTYISPSKLIEALKNNFGNR